VKRKVTEGTGKRLHHEGEEKMRKLVEGVMGEAGEDSEE